MVSEQERQELGISFDDDGEFWWVDDRLVETRNSIQFNSIQINSIKSILVSNVLRNENWAVIRNGILLHHHKYWIKLAAVSLGW